MLGCHLGVPKIIFSFRNSLEGPKELRKASLLIVMDYYNEKDTD